MAEGVPRRALLRAGLTGTVLAAAGAVAVATGAVPVPEFLSRRWADDGPDGVIPSARSSRGSRRRWICDWSPFPSLLEQHHARRVRLSGRRHRRPVEGSWGRNLGAGALSSRSDAGTRPDRPGASIQWRGWSGAAGSRQSFSTPGGRGSDAPTLVGGYDSNPGPGSGASGGEEAGRSSASRGSTRRSRRPADVRDSLEQLRFPWLG